MSKDPEAVVPAEIAGLTKRLRAWATTRKIEHCDIANPSYEDLQKDERTRWLYEACDALERAYAAPTLPDREALARVICEGLVAAGIYHSAATVGDEDLCAADAILAKYAAPASPPISDMRTRTLIERVRHNLTLRHVYPHGESRNEIITLLDALEVTLARCTCHRGGDGSGHENATAGLAEAMRDDVMKKAGVSEHIAAAALGWALKHYFPQDGAPDDQASIAQWQRKMEDGMIGYALGLAAMERHLIDRARGARDDLHALSLRVGGIAYMRAANLLAHSFAIGEASDGDPDDARPIRMLGDDGHALPPEQQVTYVARGVLTKPGIEVV